MAFQNAPCKGGDYLLPFTTLAIPSTAHAIIPFSPDAENNINSQVNPGDENSNISAELHNEGNISGISPFTSWTRDPSIASQYAKGNGIILRVKAAAPRPDEKWRWGFSDDLYYEQEILMKGPRNEGVEVYKP